MKETLYFFLCFSFCKYNGGARWQTVRELFLEHGRVHDAHFVTHARCLFVSVCWNIDYTASVARNYQVPSPKRARHSRALIGANGELVTRTELDNRLGKQSASLWESFKEEN